MSVFLCGFLPAVLVGLAAVRIIDGSIKQHRHKLLLTFMIGIVSALPAYYLQAAIHFRFQPDFEIWWHVLLVAFLVVAFVEELTKALALKLSVFVAPISSPTDILVVAVVIAMGFAGVENVLYSYAHGWEVALFRSLTSIPAHACFGLLIAYFPASEFQERYRWLPYTYGLIPAIFLHGWYDFFIIQEWSERLMLMSLLVLCLCLYMTFRVYKRIAVKANV